MSTTGFTVGDKAKGVALKFDPVAGELTATYAPSTESSVFQAILRVSEGELRQRLEELCETAAVPREARDAAVDTRLSQMAARAGYSLKAAGRTTQAALEWLIYSNENTNWTYDLSPRNLAHLANMVSVATGQPVNDITAYIAEPDQDEVLKAYIFRTVNKQPSARTGVIDTTPRWCRRLGWYAVVRALKPKLVIETGVDKGLGSVLLCAALARNAEEGHEGRYLGTDINPRAG